jgi:nucleotidyltransferase substrate binding protein (TIGR01987 family)
MQTDRDKAGAVLAFEFCYELSWKSMKRALKNSGVDADSPEEVFRKAAIAKIIDDPEIWFDFQQKRNLTTHTYEYANVEMILAIFENFSLELKKLLLKLENYATN